MKTTFLIDESGLEIRLSPETGYERKLVDAIAEWAKLKLESNVLTVPVKRDVSLESGAGTVADAAAPTSK